MVYSPLVTNHFLWKSMTPEASDKSEPPPPFRKMFHNDNWGAGINS